MGARAGRLTATTAVVFGLLAASAAAECPDVDLPLAPDTYERAAVAMECLVAEYRTAAGVHVQTVNEVLRAEARDHAARIGAGTAPYEHEDHEGTSPGKRASARGYRGFAGEDLTAGATARAAFEVLTSDEAHRDSLKREAYEDIGAGVASHPEYGGVWSIMHGDRDYDPYSFDRPPSPEPTSDRPGEPGATGGTDEAGGPAPTASRPAVRFTVASARRERRGLRVRGVATGTRVVPGARVRLRLTRSGGRATTATAKRAADGSFSVRMAIPRGRGRLTLRATLATAGGTVVRTRRLS